MKITIITISGTGSGQLKVRDLSVTLNLICRCTYTILETAAIYLACLKAACQIYKFCFKPGMLTAAVQLVCIPFLTAFFLIFFVLIVFCNLNFISFNTMKGMFTKLLINSKFFKDLFLSCKNHRCFLTSLTSVSLVTRKFVGQAFITPWYAELVPWLTSEHKQARKGAPPTLVVLLGKREN